MLSAGMRFTSGCLAVLVLASTSMAQESEVRRIYFQGQTFDLVPKPEHLAVRFAPAVAVEDKVAALLDNSTATQATVVDSLANPRTDVLTVQAPDVQRLQRNAHKLIDGQVIEFAAPIYRSEGVDLIPTGGLFVQLQNPAPGVLEGILEQYDLELHRTTTWRQDNYLLRVTAETDLDVIDICTALLQRGDVSFSQPNFIRRLTRVDEPNDTHFGMQWGLHNIGQSFGGHEDPDLDAPEGWCINKGCDGVTIAIIDEGCDMSHPDYVNKLVGGYDATDGDADATPLPADAHGTACAGIAAASTDNALGVAGVDWHARIMPIRIAYGQGHWWVTTDQWLSDGIAWAYQNGADVLSNSWGGGPPSAQIHSAIIDATIHGRGGLGSVVVFAAGNDNDPAPIYPGRHAESFCVAATSMCDERKSPTSCDGENWGSNYGSGLDVAAPGVKIPTTDIQGAAGYALGDYTMTFNGTSSATPHVAGLAALVMCKYPTYTGREVQSRIEQSCDKVGGYAYNPATGRSFELGHGRINVYRALSGKPQVPLGPPPKWPSVYRDDSDLAPPYPPTHHDSAACEWLGEEYSPEKNDNDGDDPDGKVNVDNQDAFDDGVVFSPPYIPGEVGTVEVTVSVEDPQSKRYAAGQLLYVNVWFDWEADGNWNNSHDWVVQNEPIDVSSFGNSRSQTTTYVFTVPDAAVDWHLQDDDAGEFMNVRTRLSYDQPLATADQVTDGGEVEDDRFLNFVEMFDIGVGHMTIDSSGCTDWVWIDDTQFLTHTCHPSFTPDGPAANGYMTAEVYLGPDSFDSGLRTPSFDLTELTRAFLRYEFSAVEPVTGYVYLFKNGSLDATLQVYPFSPLAVCGVLTQTIDLTPWCGDGNDDIMIEFRTFQPPCAPLEYQDWKLDNVVVWGDDIIPPDAVSVTTQPISETDNNISWVTPGDDGALRQAETYNIRYGPKPINATNWRHELWLRGDMVPNLPVPQPPGTLVFLPVTGLSAGQHFFAVRTLDEVTHIAGIGPGGSANPPAQVAPLTINATEGDLVTFLVTATDPDFDALQLYATLLPTPACAQPPPCLTYVDHGNNTATFTWQTETGDAGTHTVDLVAEDPNGLIATTTTTIQINGPPVGAGACCTGATCSIRTPLACSLIGGTFQGAGTNCTPNPCTANGACCDMAGGCMLSTGAACALAGGFYQGNGSTCTPNPCTPLGACCDTAGNCSLESSADCAAAGGTYNGDGTTCTPNLCTPTGACCDTSGGCSISTLIACTAGGGTYHGDGSTCTPDPCTAPTGACCAVGYGCSELTAASCTAIGGGYQGDNSMCTPGMCAIDFFLPLQSYATSTDPLSVAAGDFDLDGDNDLAVANRVDGILSTVSIFTNDGAGNLTLDHEVLVGNTMADVVSADFDGDGDLDLAFASGNVVLKRNNGGVFGSWSTMGVGATPTSIVAGDLDGDCTMDVITANTNPPGNNVVAIRNLSGDFSSAQWDTYLAGTNPTDLALGDFNGDGAPDLIIVNASSLDVTLRYNDGVGNLTSSVTLPSGMFGCCLSAVAVGDLDGDGALDAIVTNGNLNTIALLFNDGVGGLGAPVLQSVGSFPSDVVAVDLDGDGDLDVVLTNANSPPRLQVLENDGTGNLAAPLNFPLPFGAKRLVATHLDTTDGAVDIAVAVTGPDEVVVLRNATDQDYNGNGVSDDDEPIDTLAFVVSGVSTAQPCTYEVSGPGFSVEGEFCASVGAGGAAITNDIVRSINEVGGPGIRASRIPGLSNGFIIEAPGTGLDFCIGTAPFGPSCCFSTSTVCSCNPDIEAIQLSGEDCNANGMDDAIDLLTGDLVDDNGDGIPDSCANSPDLDGDGDVDAADLAGLLGMWGPVANCPPYPAADLNNDCTVNASDLANLLGNWGASP